jgi:hypothetical protein
MTLRVHFLSISLAEMTVIRRFLFGHLEINIMETAAFGAEWPTLL